MSSYAGTSSTGKVKQLIGLNDDIKGRTIIIVEDIIESGLTMKAILAQLAEKQPEAIHICTLLLKPDCLETELDIRYTAFEIPNDFIVGYGLDYDQQGRNLLTLINQILDISKIKSNIGNPEWTYGLDYDQQGRNLKDIYTVVEE